MEADARAQPSRPDSRPADEARTPAVVRSSKSRSWMAGRVVRRDDRLWFHVRGAPPTTGTILTAATAAWIPVFPAPEWCAAAVRPGEYVLCGTDRALRRDRRDALEPRRPLAASSEIELSWIGVGESCPLCGGAAAHLAFPLPAPAAATNWVAEELFGELVAAAQVPLHPICKRCRRRYDGETTDPKTFAKAFGVAARAVSYAPPVFAGADARRLLADVAAATEAAAADPPPPVPSRAAAAAALAAAARTDAGTAEALERVLRVAYRWAPIDPVLVDLAVELGPDPQVPAPEVRAPLAATVGTLAEAVAVVRSGSGAGLRSRPAGAQCWKTGSVALDLIADPPLWVVPRRLDHVDPVDPAQAGVVAALTDPSLVRPLGSAPMRVTGTWQRPSRPDSATLSGRGQELHDARVDAIVVTAACERCGGPSDRLLAARRRVSLDIHTYSGVLDDTLRHLVPDIRAWCSRCRPPRDHDLVAPELLADAFGIDTLRCDRLEGRARPLPDPVAFVASLRAAAVERDDVDTGHFLAAPRFASYRSWLHASEQRPLMRQEMAELVSEAAVHAAVVGDDLARLYAVLVATPVRNEAAAWLELGAPREPAPLAVVVAALLDAPAGDFHRLRHQVDPGAARLAERARQLVH